MSKVENIVGGAVNPVMKMMMIIFIIFSARNPSIGINSKSSMVKTLIPLIMSG